MTRVIDVAALDVLVAALSARGYTVVGPTVRDGAIVYDELDSAAALPTGWTDVQDGGFYRLERRDDEARFGYAVGPTSWKRFLFPPRVRLWKATQDGDGLEVEEEPVEAGPLAFIGVRAVRAGGDRDPGPGLPRRPVRRPRLRRPARGRVPRRGQLPRAGRDVLLRLDGHRPDAHATATTSC